MESEIRKYESKMLKLDIEDELAEITQAKNILRHLKLPESSATSSMINTLLFGIYLELRKFNSNVKQK